MQTVPNEVLPQVLAARLEAGAAATIVDVRSPSEYRAGHVQGAILTPLNELVAGTARCDLPPDPEQPLIVTCHAGVRARQAADLLASRGYRDITLLAGGTAAWAKAGLPMQRCGGFVTIERQVQALLATLIVLKLVFGFTVHEMFFALALLLGTAIVIFGARRWQSLAKLVERLPWNQSRRCDQRIPV